jgi:hypothetical protein
VGGQGIEGCPGWDKKNALGAAMKSEWYLVHTKVQNLKFKILELDKDTMHAKLLGDTGVPFERDISQESLDKFGYRIEKIAKPH